MCTITTNRSVQSARHRSGLCSLAIAAVLLPAHAQKADPATASDVLSGAQVTEQNLLEALSPDGVQKRSLRVKATGMRPAATRPGRPSASLLITFHTSSSMLTAGARQQLDAVGAALRNERLAAYRFTVEGHADPRGSSAANLVLSRQRAASVRTYLVDSHGIDPSRLVAEGKGDREPLNAEHPAAPENRRVTIVTQVE
jgi:outer membrane protein OmpA-like peptidoglycan-associated protein